MMRFRISLPLPPSANNLFANAAAGGRYPTKEYKQWLRGAGWIVQAEKSKQGIPSEPEQKKPYEVTLVFGMTRQRDIDNGIKAVLDLMKKQGIISDDRWVDRLIVERLRQKPASGNVVVEITHYEPPAEAA